MATDGNGRYCYLDPRMGGRIAVAEAARNVSCTGATPLAATDCLNFGNPEKPAVYYQLQQAVEGMAEACAALGAPVVSGNVSLYNESGGEPIYPTPIVGVLGLLEDVSRHCPSRFRGPGEVIALLGETREELGASEYLAQVHGLVAGRVPELDLDREAAVQRLVRAAIGAGLLRSAHDCADGGLAVALVESCSGPFGLPADDAAGAVPVIGARIEAPAEWRKLRADAVLFGESQSRILVSLRARALGGPGGPGPRGGRPAVPPGGDRRGAGGDRPLPRRAPGHGPGEARHGPRSLTPYAGGAAELDCATYEFWRLSGGTRWSGKRARVVARCCGGPWRRGP